MARPPARSPEDKERIVLAILRDELNVAETARREGAVVPRFLVAGIGGVGRHRAHRPRTRRRRHGGNLLRALVAGFLAVAGPGFVNS